MCGGDGRQERTVAGMTATGSAVLVCKCDTCDGAGRRLGFEPPV